MTLRDHEKRAAIADKYGWKILGWAVDEDNIAGISLYSKYDSQKYLRMQHSDSLKKWEEVLKQNKQRKSKVSQKAEMKARVGHAFKDAIENLDKLRASLVILEEATHE